MNEEVEAATKNIKKIIQKMESEESPRTTPEGLDSAFDNPAWQGGTKPDSRFGLCSGKPRWVNESGIRRSWLRGGYMAERLENGREIKRGGRGAFPCFTPNHVPRASPFAVRALHSCSTIAGEDEQQGELRRGSVEPIHASERPQTKGAAAEKGDDGRLAADEVGECRRTTRGGCRKHGVKPLLIRRRPVRRAAHRRSEEDGEPNSWRYRGPAMYQGRTGPI
ncbi:hypothetical protein VNO77_02833 [Canavalia gladiata]|uniref:Uncharacterized protein n=1 Tax=Canavalia gladiata TaxID=3824 RepID=A0AAN9N060_CANGL